MKGSALTPAQRAAVANFPCWVCGAPAGSVCRGIDITVSAIAGSHFYDTNMAPFDLSALAICDERMDRLDELSVIDRIAAIEKEVEGEW